MKNFIIGFITVSIGICIVMTLCYFLVTSRVYYLNSDNTITSERLNNTQVEEYNFVSPSLSDTIVRVFDNDFNLIYVAPINEVPRRVSVQPN